VDDARESRGDQPQQLIPDRVPKPVVDVLEPVEVDVQRGDG